MWSIILWFKEATNGIFRNFLINSFAIMLSVVCFSLLAVFTILGLNVKHIASVQEDKIPIVLTLKDNVVNYQEIENKLNSLSEIKEINFISKEEAFEEMRNSLGDKEKMLTDLGFNPLPATFEIKLEDGKDINRVVKTIETWGVEENIKYGEEFLENFFNVTDKINLIAFWLIILIAVSSGAVIYSSLRMNILNRSKEIEIKNLVGAGALNIRIPFILEALILTLTASTFVLGVVYFLYDEFVNLLSKDMFDASMFLNAETIIINLIPVMYFVSIIIGITSSLLSTQHYIKRH